MSNARLRLVQQSRVRRTPEQRRDPGVRAAVGVGVLGWPRSRDVVPAHEKSHEPAGAGSLPVPGLEAVLRRMVDPHPTEEHRQGPAAGSGLAPPAPSRTVPIRPAALLRPAARW